MPFKASSVAENLTAPGIFITDPNVDHQPKDSEIEVELLRDESEL